MEMTFSASDVVGSVLFEGWRVTNSAGMFGSCIAVILIAVLFETIKSYKVHRQNQRTPQKQDSEATSLLANSRHNHPRFKMRAWLKETLLYMFQFVVGYFLMLVAMTYNVWLFLAVVLGCGIGYYLANPFIEYYCTGQRAKSSQVEANVTL